MRSLGWIALFVVAGCGRTTPGPASDAPGSDAAAHPDLAAPPDAKRSPCAKACAPNERCVYIDRGDCTGAVCLAIPASCLPNPSCTCLNAGFCQSLATYPSETLACTPTPSWLPADVIYCNSSVKCV